MASSKATVLKMGATDNLLSCFNKLPLKIISLRRVAIILCGHTRILELVANTYLIPEGSLQGIDSQVECLAQSILPKICLPKSMNEELISLLKPLFREIFKWFYFHVHFFNYDKKLHFVDVLQYLCWAPLGTIDYRKTAKKLIHYEKLDIGKRYRIACLYCLYDHIKILWKQLSKEFKKSMLYPYEKKNCLNYDIEKAEIDVFWAYMMENREDKLNMLLRGLWRYSSICQCAFESVAVQGYKTATQYFFTQLTYREREISLVRTARAVAQKRSFDSVSYKQEYQKFSDVLFYLFSVMNGKQILNVLKSHPCEILKCCLDWPRQGIFVDVAELAFPYLKAEEYSRLLFILAKNATSGYHYSNIFQKFLLISPIYLRDYSLSHYGLFLKDFLFAEDVETTKFIFRNLDAAEKEILVFNISSLCCCYKLIEKKKWRMVKLFVREAKLSKINKLKFIKAVDECFRCNIVNESYKMLVSLVNNIDANISNRICSECHQAIETDLPQREDLPDIDSEENPAKKLKSN